MDSRRGSRSARGELREIERLMVMMVVLTTIGCRHGTTRGAAAARAGDRATIDSGTMTRGGMSTATRIRRG